MNRNFVVILSLCVIALSFGAGQLSAQTIWGYDYGTGSTSFTTANSNSTTFFPGTPTGGGTYRVRTSATGGGGFYRDDPGLTNFGSGTELRIMAPTTSGSNEINKFSVYGIAAANNARNAYHRYTFRLGNSTGGNADSGTFYYFFGNGTSFENDAVVTNTEAMVGIRWVLGTSGAVTASYMNAGTWTSLTGYTFQQGVNYTIEFRIHNGPGNSGSSKTYIVGGVTYTTTIYTYDIWINGTRLAGFPSAGFPQNSSFFDSYMFYAESSTGNVGAMFLDDNANTDAIDVVNAPIYYSKSTGSLHTLATWGLNSDGTGTAPANFTTASIGYHIRNNASPTITANWVVSGAAAKVELGDGVNACTFTVPSAYTYTGPIDVSNLGVLNLQNTVYPSIGLLHSGSTVRYSASGNQDVLGLSYYNLSIQGTGTKTLNNVAYVSNLTDVGDGTNAVTLTVPSAYALNGTVNVLNNGTLNLQNTVIPTMGTLSSGSTVRYSATVDQNVVPAAYSILQAYGTGNKTLSGNVSVGNRAYVGDGTNVVTLTVPATFTLTGTVDVNNNGILDIKNSTLPTLGTLATGSTVRYSYAGDQSVTGTTYYNMDVDNGFTKTMQNDVTVTNLAFANAGTLALNTYRLTLAGKDISFLSSNTVFSDLSVTNSNQIIAGLSLGPIWSTYSSFSPSNPVDVTFRYSTALSTDTTIGLWYSDSGGAWTKSGDITAVNGGDGYMYATATGLTTLGSMAKGPIKWTFADVDHTLPVELSSFTATMSATNYVQLQWVTQSETNVSGYRLYRGTDADLGNAIMLNAFVEATNTSQMQVYVYWDEEVWESGTYYYWLQNLDFDGGSSYHGPISITVNLDGSGSPVIPVKPGISSIYPNPFNPNTAIKFGLVRPDNVKVAVYNTRGQQVRMLFEGYRDQGTHTIQWDGTDTSGRSLPSGMYVIRMTAGPQVYQRKAVLMK